MDLTIDHVENLTLNFSGASARPSLADLLPTFKFERSASELKIPAIGEVWPGQGGVNAGLMAGRDGAPPYYLIAPTKDFVGIDKVRWASDEHGDTVATSKHDGLENTIELVESRFDFPAARWARGLEIDGHKDFYLPSQRELALCWINVPDLFVEGLYWSSTQSSRYFAWSQSFDDGSQGNNKSAELRARPVRRLIP